MTSLALVAFRLLLAWDVPWFASPAARLSLGFGGICGFSHCPVGLLDVLIVAPEVDGGGQEDLTQGSWRRAVGFVVQAMKEIIEDDEYPRYRDTIIDDDDQCDLGAHHECSSRSSNSSLPRRRRSRDLVALLREEDEDTGMEDVRREIEREWPAFKTGAPEDYFPVIEEEGVVFVGAPLPELVDEGRGTGSGKTSEEDLGHWERDD
ncbi:hypothetical protein LTS10_009537 [Elasticomyces elasticus]|nr:hypothetical protein LTS10_009537 [Elasticomyces elasticus]